MKSAICRLALGALLAGNLATAGDRQTEMELVISDGSSDDVVIRIDSEQDGFDLHDLQLGESRSVTTADGRPVTVTRSADTFDFNVDGRVITMPVMAEPDGRHREEIRIVRHVPGGSGQQAQGVTIISPAPLDDATRASITSALETAGHNEVRFVDVDGMPPHAMPPHGPGFDNGDEEVRIIRKEVRVTN